MSLEDQIKFKFSTWGSLQQKTDRPSRMHPLQPPPEGSAVTTSCEDTMLALDGLAPAHFIQTLPPNTINWLLHNHPTKLSVVWSVPATFYSQMFLCSCPLYPDVPTKHDDFAPAQLPDQALSGPVSSSYIFQSDVPVFLPVLSRRSHQTR